MDSEGQLYARLLLPLGHGYALWLPEPNGDLPVEYLDQGVRIGDVGIVTPDGGFDFLFNVCLPVDHPINQSRGTPDNFVHIPWNGQTYQIQNRFRPGIPIFSRRGSQRQLSIEGSVIVPGSLVGVGGGIEISFNYDSGAVLMPPNGASRLDCSHRAVFRECAQKNAHNWYQFVNGTLGREAENGSLYLVTGFDKTDSWETALFDSTHSSRSCVLTFSTGGVADGRMRLSQSSIIQSSVASRCSTTTGKYNQVLFIRGFRISLRQGLHARLLGGIRIADTYTSSSRQILGGVGRFQFNLPASHPGSPPRGGGNESPEGTRRGDGSSSPFDSSTVLDSDEYIKEQDSNASDSDTSAEESDFLPSQPYHPLSIINDSILRNNHDVDIVVTHDDDWIMLLTKEDSVMPDDQVLVQRFEEKFHVSVTNGLAILEPVSDQVRADGRPSETMSESAQYNRSSRRISDGAVQTPHSRIIISHDGEDAVKKHVPRFRVLVMGRRNAGKTTILQKMTQSSDGEFIVRDSNGNQVDPGSILQPSVERGRSRIDWEITYPRSSFHSLKWVV
uniref:G domain-containing protein n=1 Tax=Moniliophthora roreri TaxID=221103 RepID=A0A0W0G752_MONRR